MIRGLGLHGLVAMMQWVAVGAAKRELSGTLEAAPGSAISGARGVNQVVVTRVGHRFLMVKNSDQQALLLLVGVADESAQHFLQDAWRDHP
jgi:hypothetical protein